MGKKMKAAAAKVEPRPYALREAVALVKSAAYAKFDESVDLAIRLGVDPKRSDRAAGRRVRRLADLAVLGDWPRPGRPWARRPERAPPWSRAARSRTLKRVDSLARIVVVAGRPARSGCSTR